MVDEKVPEVKAKDPLEDQPDKVLFLEEFPGQNGQ